MIFSPLEQFEIKLFWFDLLHNVFYYFYDILDEERNYGIIFNNFSFYSLLVCLFIYFIFFQLNIRRTILPQKVIYYYSEKLILFFINIVMSNFDYKFWGRKYFAFLFTIFFLILFSNLLGLIPFGFTNTSFPVECLSISVSMLIGFTILSIYIQGNHFIEHFVPKDIPLLLMPMLVVIEIISYFSKAFSLSIRLFANMMSGHILLNILSSFSLKLSKISLLIGIIPFLIVLSISFLEVGICFLQAYVFMLLLTLYFNDSCKLDNEYYSKYAVEDSLWEWCLIYGFSGFTLNKFNYNSLLIYRMRYEYERRIFFGKVHYMSEESKYLLDFKEGDIHNLLFNFSIYSVEEDDLTRINEFFEYFDFVYFYLSDSVLQYSLLVKCHCEYRFSSWYGLVILITHIQDRLKYHKIIKSVYQY